MFQSISDFFEMIGVDISWPVMILILIIILALVSGKKLEYKVKEYKNKDGSKEYRIFKYFN